MSAPAVVILAAGEGTRMRSATPKLLHPICGRPMIAWPVAAAQGAGSAKVVVVDSAARRLAGAVSGVEFAIQERANGTADAVKAAGPHISGHETVIVMHGDHPLITSHTLEGLVAAHISSGAAATVATAVLEDPSGYGRVVRGPDGAVEKIVETKAPGDAGEGELQIREINTGLYAFEGAELLGALDDVSTDNAQGEQYLPDVLRILRARGRSVAAHQISDSGELGINDRAGLAAVRAVAQRRIHEGHMLAGVTIVDPGCTLIDVGVQIGSDSVIEPYTSLRGATSIGERTTVGPLSTLIDTQVGDGARVVHSYTIGADIGERVSVGPFTYLRPGTLLRGGSKAGAFVEIKNSDVGAGTKIPHLSYIGDADIGEGTNLGASTITANYDGSRKHRTTIGAGVKTSVDTTLVAPVELGDRAYTGAGSVITEDVPPDGLGMARARQSNIEGYAERRRQRDAAPAGQRDVASASDADGTDASDST
ncbi:MAG TPA: bifunctional UDP-N-acetylglucosamine diphosphorylase/glucosamine-1-phosphate N-acetyltransferase GlmU [Solirubrobacteraceae bacterium]